MTFLAENELSAMYVPARFLPRIHPAYVETAQFLASQIADEARHVDVFTKRARAAGGTLGVSAASSMRSLLSLFNQDDFSEASFLLSALGEGTFLDLLRFLEEHAPDEVTGEVVRRARVDEARHVHFGLAHLRHGIANNPGLVSRLESTVRKRAATLAGVTSLPSSLADALVIYVARGVDPPSVERAHDRVRAWQSGLAEARVKRLVHAGIAPVEAELLSSLHTPNIM
jgi:hypothetical protein